MDTDQAVYHRGYSQEHDPNSAHNQEGEEKNDHHEKKSVLKRVKQKAKKIKDTIKKHGHGLNHDHDRGNQYPEGGIPDDHDLHEEDDDEEDIVDPEAHGAPMYESAAVRSALSSQPEDLSGPEITNERTKAMQPDTQAPIDSSTTFYSGSETEKTKYNNDPAKTSVTGVEATLVTEQPNVNFGRQSAVFDEPVSPQNTPVSISRQSRDDDPTKTIVHGEKEYPGQPEVNLQRPKGLEEDPAGSETEKTKYNNDPAKTSVTGMEATLVTEQPNVNFGRQSAVFDEPVSPQNTPVPISRQSRDDPTKTFVHGEYPGQPEVNLQKPNGLEEDPAGSETEKTKYNNDPAKTSVTGMEATLVTEQPSVNFGRQIAAFDEPVSPQNTPVPISRQSRDDDPTKTFVHGEKEYPGQPEVNLQRPKGLEEDPAAPKDIPDAYTTTNYQTKVTDPTGKGGEVTGITPILHSFNKMNFDDQQDIGRKQNVPPGSHHRPSEFSFPTGSHDQSYPEPTAPSLTQTSAEKSPSVSETMDTLKPREQLHNIESDKPSNQSSYEVTDITPTRHSFDKMNFEDEQDTGREQNFPPGSYNTQSDLPFPTGSHDQFSPEPAAPTSLVKTPEKSPSVSDTMSTSKPQEHLPNVESDKPSNQSSYTEKISSATSAIADKAVSAKNTVASKLGYGEKDQTPANESHEGQGDATKKSSAVDYGKKIAVTVTEKLTPVYEKVAGAGSTVMSKLHGPGTGTATEVGSTEVQEQDKGVSVRNYISEKLRPGEEDRALSQVITDALRTQKGETQKETRARGKVTESEEVARRLGTAGSENSPSSGMVDKLKGTVSSWFGKADGSQQVQGSPQGNEDFSSSTYERRLQESGN